MCAADTLHRHLHRASVAEARRRQHSMTHRAPPGASCWTCPARRSCLRTRPPGRRRMRPPSWHQQSAVPPPCRRRRQQQRQSLRQTPPRQTAGLSFWSTWRPAACSTALMRSMRWQRHTVPLAHLRACRRVSLGKISQPQSSMEGKSVCACRGRVCTLTFLHPSFSNWHALAPAQLHA